MSKYQSRHELDNKLPTVHADLQSSVWKSGEVCQVLKPTYLAVLKCIAGFRQCVLTKLLKKAEREAFCHSLHYSRPSHCPSIETSNGPHAVWYDTTERTYSSNYSVLRYIINHTHEHHRCMVSWLIESCEVSNSQKPSVNNAFLLCCDRLN